MRCTNGEKGVPESNTKTKKRKATMKDEEMIAELNTQLMVKENRVRRLARMVVELPLMRENLPALETYAIGLRSLAYQIRQLQAAKTAALAAK